jgi:hypothetical protein
VRKYRVYGKGDDFRDFADIRTLIKENPLSPVLKVVDSVAYVVKKQNAILQKLLSKKRKND